MIDLPWWGWMLGYVYFGFAVTVVVDPDDPKSGDGDLNGPIGCFIFWPLVAIIYPWVVLGRRWTAPPKMTCTVCQMEMTATRYGWPNNPMETHDSFKRAYDVLRGEGGRGGYRCSRCGADTSVALSKMQVFKDWRIQHEATEAAKIRAEAFNAAIASEAKKSREEWDR